MCGKNWPISCIHVLCQTAKLNVWNSRKYGLKIRQDPAFMYAKKIHKDVVIQVVVKEIKKREYTVADQELSG